MITSLQAFCYKASVMAIKKYAIVPGNVVGTGRKKCNKKVLPLQVIFTTFENDF